MNLAQIIPKNIGGNASTSTLCSPDVREEDNLMYHEAESFVQRKCDVITTRPIESPKIPLSFR